MCHSAATSLSFLCMTISSTLASWKSISSSSSLYWVSDTELSYLSAMDDCKDRNSHLAFLETPKEADDLHALAQALNSGSPYWIGLIRESATNIDSKWRWSSSRESPIVGDELSYKTKFSSGEDTVEDKDRVFVDQEWWKTEKTDATKYYVCEKGEGEITATPTTTEPATQPPTTTQRPRSTPSATDKVTVSLTPTSEPSRTVFTHTAKGSLHETQSSTTKGSLHETQSSTTKGSLHETQSSTTKGSLHETQSSTTKGSSHETQSSTTKGSLHETQSSTTTVLTTFTAVSITERQQTISLPLFESTTLPFTTSQELSTTAEKTNEFPTTSLESTTMPIRTSQELSTTAEKTTEFPTTSLESTTTPITTSKELSTTAEKRNEFTTTSFRSDGSPETDTVRTSSAAHETSETAQQNLTTSTDYFHLKQSTATEDGKTVDASFDLEAFLNSEPVKAKLSPMFTESDSRVSAIAVGTLGILILVCVLAYILLLDLSTLTRDLSLLKENLNCCQKAAGDREDLNHRYGNDVSCSVV